MKTWHVLLVLFLCALSFFAGHKTVSVQNMEYVRIDTIRDTTRIVEPILVEQSPVLNILEVPYPVEVVRTDTVDRLVYIPVPIKQSVYSDSLYTAWVSGYEAKLDSILIKSNTVQIERTVQKKSRRWGLGLSAGYGLTLARNGPSPIVIGPMVGISVFYRLW